MKTRMRKRKRKNNSDVIGVVIGVGVGEPLVDAIEDEEVLLSVLLVFLEFILLLEMAFFVEFVFRLGGAVGGEIALLLLSLLSPPVIEASDCFSVCPNEGIIWFLVCSLFLARSS